MEKLHKQLRKKIRIWIIFFIIALVLSGITAFPIEMQLKLAVKYLTFLPAFLYAWINEVYIGINSTNANFPFLAYGTDWLAFAHIVIAVAFVGPLKDPVKNIWVIQFGMIACLMVIPLALIAGAIRDIPFFWRMIDCSFGVFGIIPLYIVYKYIKKLEHIRC
ncbi:MAG: hypothetical protein HOG05_02775 [Bacteroidetes bacterium]|jgi:hypothetical protein|nr:hypothetical protein [Bacteroidota bacterium]MBT5530007.1 hypothetical protein [Cytophagia bacterium]MBT3422358.1 hypothetical protein [Bacteroidota bacterium]MBT3800051.1 hypothetical protein [Bacteroidota bacterium]MBT3934087.1 hypothetical protein [Bacteroidota bacterium]